MVDFKIRIFVIKPVLLFTCLVALLCASAMSAADIPSLSLQRVLEQVHKKNLASSTTWLRLGHYEPDNTKESGWNSAILVSSFFFAEDGKTNPASELNATIAAFFQPVGDNPDLHGQCLFKGRYIWLISQLKLQEHIFPAVPCAAFTEWTKGQAVDSISLLYATGYLSNPASFYGHTLLKFNSANADRSPLLDVTINYGAIVPTNEDPVTYIFKGVTGGYDAGFSHIQYYFHNHNYGELELRDLWEYELSLSQSQVDLIMGHLWELLGKKYRYFFFRKNCAYRVAEILELVDGLDIIPRRHPYVYPQTIVTKIGEANINGKPAIKAIKYHPSRQARFYNKYEQLDDVEKIVLKEAAIDIGVLHAHQYNQLGVTSKQAVLETLADYYQISGAIENTSEEIKSDYNRVLSERFNLPAGNTFSSINAGKSPHQGRPPSYFQLSGISNQAVNEGVGITIRPSYYDVLDGGSGHVVNSELRMGELKLNYLDNGLLLRKLDIVSVLSINGARTGLPGDHGQTWRLRLGLEQQNLLCDSCLIARFQGDVGRAKYIWPSVVVGANVGGAIQDNKNGYGALYAKSSIFVNARLTDNSNFRLEFENRHHLDSNQGDEAVYSFEFRRSLKKNMDVRLLFESNKTQEYSLSIGYYW